MTELDRVLRGILLHEGVVDLAGCNHRPHWNGTVGDLLGKVHDVRGDAKVLGAGPAAEATKTGDDLVKNQQNVMLVANFAQTLQVALGRYDGTRRA